MVSNSTLNWQIPLTFPQCSVISVLNVSNGNQRE